MHVVGAVALVAYGTALGAPSVGHGFRLAAHLFAEHHEASEALMFRPGDADEHGDAHEDGEAHTHDEAHDHAQSPLPERALADARTRPSRLSPGPVRARPAGSPGFKGDSERTGRSAQPASASEQGVRLHGEAHEHGGPDEHAAVPEPREAPGTGVHTHDGRAHSHRESPPVATLLTLALDKHCVPPRCAVPAPRPARGMGAVTPAAAHVPVVLPVEVRPPEQRA